MSQLPGLLFAFFQAVLAVILYLDARFSIHQRFAVALGIFFEGLVEIEKEVGLLRNAGEALSVGWCGMRLSSAPTSRVLTTSSSAGKRQSRVSSVSAIYCPFGKVTFC